MFDAPIFSQILGVGTSHATDHLPIIDSVIDHKDLT